MLKARKNCFSDGFLFRLRFCFIFFSVLFLLLYCLTYFYNLSFFLALLPFVLALYIFSVFTLIKFLNRKDEIIQQLFFDFKLDGENDFKKFPLPIIVCAEDGVVMWCNDYFLKNISPKKSYVGENFLGVLKKPLSFSCKNNRHLNIDFEGMNFKVFVTYLKASSLYLLYFEDVTDYLYLKREYEISKPCVFYIMVDNYKEMLADKKDSERSSILGKIDTIVEEFVDGYMGFMQKYRENEFLVVLEVRHLSNICKGKFSILQKVRDITGDENFYLTLSIGVGAYGASLNECAKFAMQALDMALGRGGDQAAVKTPDSFNFYGGTSKGVEKNTRVRARVIANALAKLIENSKNVILMGHKFADLDSVGSAIGLASVIRKMGKDSFVLVDSVKNLSGMFLDKLKQHGFYDIIIDENMALSMLHFNTLLIIVDTHNPKFLECYELYENCKNVVVIDHHRKMVDAINDAVIFYHEPYASSTSELVCELIQYFGDGYKLKPIEAEGLLAGIMLDTKNFTVKVGVRTFEAAAYLKRLGADTVNVRKFFSNSITAYQKRTKIVVGAQIYRNCAIAVNELNTPDARLISPQAADELLEITGIEASFVIYKLDDVINITARSLGKLNVQVIMEYLGGGGHQLQAACQIRNINNIEQVKHMLLEAIDRWLD